jgi:hypothetical protein
MEVAKQFVDAVEAAKNDRFASRRTAVSATA